MEEKARKGSEGKREEGRKRKGQDYGEGRERKGKRNVDSNEMTDSIGYLSE